MRGSIGCAGFRHGGTTRRHVLQIGALAGLGLPRVLRAEQAPGSRARFRAKSIIFLHQFGGASHHDTFDMKPGAPEKIRGEFQPIATSTAGVHICEHLPRLAARAHRYALVRSLSHRDNNHLMSTHHPIKEADN